MHICGQFVAWNSPCIQNGAVPRHPVWCPPLYLARGCKISISFATCARRGRTDGGKGPPTFVERNKTPLPLSLLRVRLTPRLWVSLCLSRSRLRPEASFFFVPAVRTAARQVLRDLFYGAKERTRGYFTPQISGGRDRPGKGARGKSAN